MAQKGDAVVFLLDVGPSACSAPPGHATFLQTAVKVINMIVQHRMFAGSKDEIGLVLFGTRETDNPLAESGGYDHVTLAHKLAAPSLDFLKLIQNEITPGNEDGDFIDALVVAMDHAQHHMKGRKLGGAKFILFTDCGSPASQDQLESIEGGLASMEAQLQVIGPDVDDDDLENGSASGPPPPPPSGKPKTDTQRSGENLLKRLVSSIDGTFLSFADAMVTLAFFARRQARQTSVFRGPLEIGSTLKINVWGYYRVKEQKTISFEKVSAVSQASKYPGSMKVKLERSYHLNDENQTEVAKENVAEGFWYGKDLIPIARVDKDAMKFKTPRCLKALGFTKETNIKHHQYLGDGVVAFVPAQNDQEAGVALSALVHAMQETGLVMIVKYSFRANAEPKIGVCTPHIKPDYECLLFTQLPYMEDLRQYTFATLDSKKHVATDDQVQAVDDLITSMDLMQAERDDSGDLGEAFKPKSTFNPVLQRIYQCIQHRALNPDDPLPEVDPLIADCLKMPSAIVAASELATEKIRAAFPLEKIEKKAKRTTTAATMWKDTGSLDLDNPAPLPKQARLGDADDLSMAGLAKSQVKEVGTVDPVGDFNSLVNMKDVDLFDEAFGQMKKRVCQLIFDSLGDQYHGKAMECLKALRDAAVKFREPGKFNEFLIELKEQLIAGRGTIFWVKIKDEKVSLITTAEANDSSVSAEKAREFLSSTEKEVPVEENPNAAAEEDAEDLLDMM
ncbi:X-ray repair cross-complementing protein 5-like [Oscarella lobularis]|uniref:X-ray repair cross-complementing protein 5-like n=1 Tax=Oscarella lobularis TaxID=121494 RepID=UPI0033141574